MYISKSDLKKLLLDSQNPENYLTVYTYQHKNILEKLDTFGYLAGNAKFSMFKNHKSDPYVWMREKLSEKLINYSGNYPIWAWPKRLSKKDIKESYSLDFIEIEAKITWKRILMSDFELWHCVLNNSYLALDEDEWNEMQDCDQKQKENSWNRIFSFDLAKNKEQIEWIGAKRSIQFCVDRIYANEISVVRHIK